jgi:hypothetical protein
MKKLKEILSIADLSPSSRSQCNVCQWKNWNLHLLPSSSKHMRVMVSYVPPPQGEGLTHLCLSWNSQLFGSSGWIGTFKIRPNIAFRSLSSESRSVDLGTVEDWKNYWVLQEIEAYDLCDINYADETGPFFSLQPSKTLTFQNHYCRGGKSKQWFTVLLVCNEDGGD